METCTSRQFHIILLEMLGAEKQLGACALARLELVTNVRRDFLHIVEEQKY